MTRSAISIVSWGIYSLLAGMVLLIHPNPTLQFLGFEKTQEHWILIVALLMMGLGFYYVVLGATKVKQFFVISSLGRFIFFVATLILIALNKAPLSIILFGVIDLITAAWTLIAMHLDKKVSQLAT